MGIVILVLIGAVIMISKNQIKSKEIQIKALDKIIDKLALENEKLEKQNKYIKKEII